MAIYDLLSQMEERLRSYVRQEIGKALEYTNYSLSSKNGTGDKTKGRAVESDGTPAYDHQAQRMQHFGFRSRPPANTPCVRLAMGGGGTNGVIVAEEPADRYGPQDLEEGETAIYSTAMCSIKIDKNGKVIFTAAAGQVVEINGNTYSLLKTEDFLKGTNALSDAMFAIQTALNTACANGVPLIVIGSPDDVKLTSFGAALTGTTYLSDKGKNG